MSARASSRQARRGAPKNTSYHAWDVILKYYQMKGGPEYNAAPARKLSMSFGLDLSNGAGQTSNSTSGNNRQALLTVINQIINTHEPYKRSPDAMFKAFICAGLK